MPPVPTRPERLYTGPATPIAYDKAWQVYTNLSKDQIAWFQSQPQDLVKYAGTKRWQKEICSKAPNDTTPPGITVGGMLLDTSEKSQALVTGLAVRASRDASSNPSATYEFTDNGVSETITITQALGLFDAMSGYIQLCRKAESTLLVGINATPPTITSRDQIDAAYAAITTNF